LTKEEFMELFFEDLALPRLLRNHIGNTLQYKTRRAGYSHDGTPSNLALVRTMRGALGRRIALTKARTVSSRCWKNSLKLCWRRMTAPVSQ
jgi:uncharacterized sporulation protein YeaH/YhbH (DUF444 family)